MRRKLSEITHFKKIIGVVGITLFIAYIVVGFISFSPSNLIQKYDDVKIRYTVWESSEARNYDEFNPIFNSDIWVIMIPITENDTNGLILGLYNNLLGREQYYESGLFWLDKCIDQDRDGVDDITGEPALTYGNSSDLYFNTCLMIEFRVLDIQKSSGAQDISFDWAGFTQFSQNILKILFWFHPLLVLLIAIFFGYVFEYFNEHRINISIGGSKILKGLFKYGLMIGICASIPFIIIGIINLTLSPEEFYLLKTRYDFFVNSIILLIVLCCLAFIVSYLLLYRSKGKE